MRAFSKSPPCQPTRKKIIAPRPVSSIFGNGRAGFADTRDCNGACARCPGPVRPARVRVEAQATARLRHPNIVEVTDYCVSAAGRPCLVMEKLRGCTLRHEVAQRGGLPLSECLGLLEQLLAGLAAAHKMGVVHRDLKPDNVILHEHAGGGRRLKVLDFGLARVPPTAPVGAPRPSSIPIKTGRVVGTPGYVSSQGMRPSRRGPGMLTKISLRGGAAPRIGAMFMHRSICIPAFRKRLARPSGGLCSWCRLPEAGRFQISRRLGPFSQKLRERQGRGAPSATRTSAPAAPRRPRPRPTGQAPPS